MKSIGFWSRIVICSVFYVESEENVGREKRIESNKEQVIMPE